ncbi:MAG: four helix bundle protein [Planctomycetota bacterium]
MSKEISERLYQFALRIIQLVRMLPSELAAREIGKQLIRSGSSVAANYEEATVAFSKNDFTYKLSTSFKEAKETWFWLRLLQDSEIVKGEIIQPLIQESHEIANILGKSVKTAKGRK